MKLMAIESDVQMLNSTLEIVAMSFNDYGDNTDALQEVYVVKSQVLLQEQTVNGKKNINHISHNGLIVARFAVLRQ